jgi:hypothetical protein
MLRWPLAIALLFAPATALAGGFAGFVAEGNGFLAAPDQLCLPIPVSKKGVAKGAPASCRPATEDELGGRDLPAATTALAVSIRPTLRGAQGPSKKRTLAIVSQDRPLVTWAAPQPIEAVTAVYAAADGLHLAVELTYKGQPQVVGFLLAAPIPERAGAYDRAMAKGGTWEQRPVACETAGVKLELKATRRFTVTIETKCQGSRERSRFAGTFTAVGDDLVKLFLPQDDGPDEVMECHFAACADVPGEACLSCGEDEDRFTLFATARGRTK